MTHGNEKELSGVVMIDTGSDALRERYALSMARMDSLGTDVSEAFRAYFKEAAHFVKESCTDRDFADRRGMDRSRSDKNRTDKNRTEKSHTERSCTAPAASSEQGSAGDGQTLGELCRLLNLWRDELGALPYLYASGRLMDVDILLETLIQIENIFAACGREGDALPPQKAVRDVIYSYLYDYLPVFAEEAADAFLSECAAALTGKREDTAEKSKKTMPQNKEKRQTSGRETANAVPVPVRLLDCVLFPECLMTECLAAAKQCGLPHWQLTDLALFQGDRLEAMLLRSLSGALRERQSGMRKQDRDHCADAASAEERLKYRANAASAEERLEYRVNAVSVTAYPERDADDASAAECPECLSNAAAQGTKCPEQCAVSQLGASVLFAAPFTAHQQKVNRHMLKETAALWQQAFSGKVIHGKQAAATPLALDKGESLP